MMQTSTTVPDPVTPSWLTVVLRESGILKEGRGIAVDIRSSGAFNSQTSHVVLTYDSEAPDDVPKQFVLKRNTSDAWSKEAGAEEVKYYSLTTAFKGYPSISVPCYAAAYDEPSGNSYILMLDVSETHAPPITRDQQLTIVEGVPAKAHIESVVNTLADLHAWWWEHPLLDADVFQVGYWSRDAERFRQYLARRRKSWEGLLESNEVWLPDDVRDLYEYILARLPHYWEMYLEPRFRSKTRLTLVHGDSYFSNFMCPKNPAIVPACTYLLDWQSPSFDIGGYDLANLCAAYWTPEQRRENQREEGILRQYHARLTANNVRGYTWNDLVTDYQHGLIFWLLMPVQDGYDGSDRMYWWPKMQCLIEAFRDWHCEELLEQ